MNEFPQKGWSGANLDRLIQKIDTHGTTDKRPGSVHSKSIKTTDNIAVVQDLIYSQDDAPHTHKSPCSMWRLKLNLLYISTIILKGMTKYK